MSFHNLKPLSEVMDELKSKGFSRDFVFREEKLMLMDGDHKKYGSNDLTIIEEYRFEGDSDPGMMTILYALEGKDGVKGTISNAYGVNSDDNLGEFMKNVKEKRER